MKLTTVILKKWYINKNTISIKVPIIKEDDFEIIDKHKHVEVRLQKLNCIKLQFFLNYQYFISVCFNVNIIHFELSDKRMNWFCNEMFFIVSH